jgi:hypothetical protein
VQRPSLVPDSGIVYQDVASSELRSDSFPKRCNGFGIAQVAGHCLRPAATNLSADGLQEAGVAAYQHHRRPHLRQTPCDGAANASSGAGDHRNLLRQFSAKRIRHR